MKCLFIKNVRIQSDPAFLRTATPPPSPRIEIPIVLKLCLLH